MPSGDVATVRSLERDSQSCTVARAGDNVAVCLLGIDASQVMAGGVLCHPDFPVAVAKHLELKILTLDGATPILTGSQVTRNKILFPLKPKCLYVSVLLETKMKHWCPFEIAVFPPMHMEMQHNM